jgi:hypothetical protein
MSGPERSVAVIGLGPRGLSVVERLSANAGERCRGGTASPAPARLTVHIIDPHEPGAGGVWRTSQHRHLLMNTVASQVTVFTDRSVDLTGPLVPGPSLYEWAKAMDDDAADPTVVAEARALGPDDYPTRSFYGHYLSWVFQRLVESAPPNVVVRPHATRALSLEDSVGGRQLITLEGEPPLEVDDVVLSLGHVPAELSPTERAALRFADEHGLVYVPPVNPADADLELVPAGEPVILRGLGLNFFDHMALLTLGRGGRFSRDGDRLVYHPSGREPRLYAGSRRGVPYQARGENEKGAHGRYEPLFVTQAVIRRFRELADGGHSVKFRRDVWPLVAKEVETAYYRALLAEGSPLHADRFLTEYRAHPWGSPAEAEVLARYGIGSEQRWSWRRIARPVPAAAQTDHRTYVRWLRGYLREDIAEALRGNVTGPVKAALDVLRDLRNEVRLIVDHGGVDGDSYREDLEIWYTPLNAYLSIGPPVARTEQLLALIDSGVLTPLGPDLRVELAAGSGSFVATTSVPDERVSAGALIEARLPCTDCRRSRDPLIGHLLRTGQARPYRIDTPYGEPHETGGIAVTGRPYRIVNARGEVHPHRYAFGVPTEGVHWVTAAGIRPGVNSVTLGDSDSIARAVLALDLPKAADRAGGLHPVLRVPSMEKARSAR